MYQLQHDITFVLEMAMIFLSNMNGIINGDREKVRPCSVVDDNNSLSNEAFQTINEQQSIDQVLVWLDF